MNGIDDDVGDGMRGRRRDMGGVGVVNIFNNNKNLCLNVRKIKIRKT